MFGASLDLDLLGIEVGDKTLIPGLAVASSRAKPLAGVYYISTPPLQEILRWIRSIMGLFFFMGTYLSVSWSIMDRIQLSIFPPSNISSPIVEV